MSVARRVPSLVALGLSLSLPVAAVAGLAGGESATAAPNPTTFSSHTTQAGGHGARSAITWNGWRGVDFGDRVRAAHHRLGGTFTHSTAGAGGCGDILQVRTVTLDAKVGPTKHRVSDISVDASRKSVSFPLGIDAQLTATKIERRLKAHGYRTHTVRMDSPGDSDFVNESTSVGPHGHTLYFTSDGDSGDVYRLGLAVNRHVARQLLTINGC